MSNYANTNLTRLSEEDRNLIFNIRSLPNISCVRMWTSQQKSWWEYRNKEWQFISTFIGFRQMSDLGCDVSFSMDMDCDPQAVNLLISKGNIWFSQFQLIINQFDNIQKFSLSNNRQFPFSSARHFFSQVLREVSNFENENVLSSRMNQGSSATELKKGFKKLQHFWRKKLNNQELSKFENYLRSSPEWCDFWVYCVWSAYYSNPKQPKKFKYLWDEHLKALDSLDKLLSQSSKETGILLTIPKWSGGYPHEPKSGKKICFPA